MPRVKAITAAQEEERRLRAELVRCETLYGCSPGKMAKTMGVSAATYYNRKREPLKMSIGEAMKLQRAFPEAMILKGV